MRHFFCIVVLLSGPLAGCSSQQLYATGQEVQRAECRKIVDMQEQRRCLEKAGMSHDDYKRQAEAAKAGK